MSCTFGLPQDHGLSLGFDGHAAFKVTKAAPINKGCAEFCLSRYAGDLSGVRGVLAPQLVQLRPASIIIWVGNSSEEIRSLCADQFAKAIITAGGSALEEIQIL